MMKPTTRWENLAHLKTARRKYLSNIAHNETSYPDVADEAIA
jgi:hypothetical protein